MDRRYVHDNEDDDYDEDDEVVEDEFDDDDIDEGRSMSGSLSSGRGPRVDELDDEGEEEDDAASQPTHEGEEEEAQSKCRACWQITSERVLIAMDTWPVMLLISIVTIWALLGVCALGLGF